jgi:hypothetical protein
VQGNYIARMEALEVTALGQIAGGALPARAAALEQHRRSDRRRLLLDACAKYCQ